MSDLSANSGALLRNKVLEDSSGLKCFVSLKINFSELIVRPLGDVQHQDVTVDFILHVDRRIAMPAVKDSQIVRSIIGKRQGASFRVVKPFHPHWFLSSS